MIQLRIFLQIEMKISTVYSLNVKAPGWRHDLVLLQQRHALRGTLAARAPHSPTGMGGDGEGGEGGGSSVLRLRLESSFVFSSKFGVGNPSVPAG